MARRSIHGLHAGRLLAATAKGAGRVERIASDLIDREEAERAADDYDLLSGANLPLDERRSRARANNRLQPHAVR